MNSNQTDEPARRPLRLWPGVALAALLAILFFVVPIVLPDALAVGFLGSVACGLLIALWWLFASRAPWIERLAAVALMAGAVFATRPILDPSIRTGAMGMLFYLLVVPTMTLAFVAAVAATRNRPDAIRRAAIVAAIVVGCGGWALVRTGGFTGDGKQDLDWRWAMTPEDRLLAQGDDVPASLAPAPAPEPAPSASPAAAPQPSGAEPQASGAPPQASEGAPAGASPAPAAAKASVPAAVEVADGPRPAAPDPASSAPPAAWPGFRGPGRDGHVRGVRIATDWSASPPVELWRRAVGPGWSSFAVRGDLVYTQEQRGEDEVVATYRLATGEPVWRHRDPARFWESNGGAGPRGTPTLAGGRVYTLGGTGLVNALDAATGAVVWSRDAAKDTGAKTPMWGFSGSPLVTDDLVIVAASGALVAYEKPSGRPRWVGPVRGPSYSSPQLAVIDGVPQVLLMSGTGVASVAPADGTLLWEHAWKGYPIVQPALTAEGDVLIAANESSGTRRLTVARGSGGWAAQERWTSNGLKPYFNDFVVHEGHAFGFDGRILSCIDLADGQRKWKGGRYGHGQLVLLPDQDVLLVLSEEGELALVGATTDAFRELGRFPAIQGKTWNHPVVAGDTLLVRNGEEMAAFRLALARP
jgi:outer membrane protein assembly factor BamB